MKSKPLPSLARMNGEGNPFTVLGAIVPPGAPMRALIQIQDERTRLVEALREAEVLRPKVLKGMGYVPEYVLEYCNKARSLLRELGE